MEFSGINIRFLKLVFLLGSTLFASVFSISSFGDEVNCNTTGSKKVSESLYLICSEGQSEVRNQAMEQALINGRKEFFQYCAQAYCDSANVLVSPTRSECTEADDQFSCVRFFEYQIVDLSFQSTFKSCSQLTVRNFGDEMFEVCGMAQESEEGLALTAALDDAKKQFFELCNRDYCHRRNIDILPIDSFCRRTIDGLVECSNHVRVEVLDTRFDPDITDEHHVNELNILVGMAVENWIYEDEFRTEEEYQVSGASYRIGYSFTEHVSMHFNLLDITTNQNARQHQVSRFGRSLDFTYYVFGYSKGFYLGAGFARTEHEVLERTYIGDGYQLVSAREEQIGYGLAGVKMYFGSAILDLGYQARAESDIGFSGSQFALRFGVSF